MKKKWKKTLLILGGVLLAVSPISTNILHYVSNANNTYYSTDNALYDNQLLEATNYLDTAKQTMTEEDIEKAIDTIVELPYSEEYKSDEKELLLDNVFSFINGMDDSSKVKYGVYLVDKAIKRTTDTLFYPDYELADKLVKSLPEGNLRTQYATILVEVQKEIDEEIFEDNINGNEGGAMTPPIDFSELPESAFLPYEEVDTGDYLPGFEPKPEDLKDKPPTLPEESFTQYVEYLTQDGVCYKVTTKTIQGKSPVVTKEKVTGTNAVFCPVVFDNHEHEGNYDLGKVQPAPAGTGQNIRNSADNSSSYFNIEGSSKNSQDKGTEKSILSLQYTLDKTEKEPYFYETDFGVTKNHTITYQQQKDVLFQLAIRSGGKAVDDKDRFLVLLENKIIVIENKGDNIPVSSFDTLLKGFKAQIKAMETKVGQ